MATVVAGPTIALGPGLRASAAPAAIALAAALALFTPLFASLVAAPFAVLSSHGCARRRQGSGDERHDGQQ